MASPVLFQSKLCCSDSSGGPSWWWLVQKDESWEALVALWSGLWWWGMNLLVYFLFSVWMLGSSDSQECFSLMAGQCCCCSMCKTEPGAFLWPRTPSTSAVLFRQPLCARLASCPALCLMAQGAPLQCRWYWFWIMSSCLALLSLTMSALICGPFGVNANTLRVAAEREVFA